MGTVMNCYCFIYGIEAKANNCALSLASDVFVICFTKSREKSLATGTSVLQNEPKVIKVVILTTNLGSSVSHANFFQSWDVFFFCGMP